MSQNRGSKRRQYERGRGKKMHKAGREKEGAAWLIVAYAKEPMMPAGFIELHWECQVGGRFGGLVVSVMGLEAREASKQVTI